MNIDVICYDTTCGRLQVFYEVKILGTLGYLSSALKKISECWFQEQRRADTPAGAGLDWHVVPVRSEAVSLKEMLQF